MSLLREVIKMNIPFTIDSNKTLDIKDLLPTIPADLVIKVTDKKQSLSIDEEEFLLKMTRATGNANSSILAGISAIGELIAHSAEEVSIDSIRNIGWLINSLGDQAHAINSLNEEANDLLKSNQKPKPFVAGEVMS